MYNFIRQNKSKNEHSPVQINYQREWHFWIKKNVHTLSWPPTSQTVKLMFLYSTVSTLNPNQIIMIIESNYYIEKKKRDNEPNWVELGRDGSVSYLWWEWWWQSRRAWAYREWWSYQPHRDPPWVYASLSWQRDDWKAWWKTAPFSPRDQNKYLLTISLNHRDDLDRANCTIIFQEIGSHKVEEPRSEQIMQIEAKWEKSNSIYAADLRKK